MEIDAKDANIEQFLPQWEEIWLEFQDEFKDSPDMAIEQVLNKCIALTTCYVAVHLDNLFKEL